MLQYLLLYSDDLYPVVALGDTQNFIWDKYNEKISRYIEYRDTGFETIKKYIMLRTGREHSMTNSITDNGGS